MEKQVTRNKSQAGFSLVELLVVVAIIGVLAAAGIVGYTSYLNGVKEDTHKANAQAIAQALRTTGIARIGGLQVKPDACKSDASPNTAVACAAKVAEDGKFKSTLPLTVLSGASYVSAGNSGACSDSTKGMLVVKEPSAAGASTPVEGEVLACSKDSASSIGKFAFGSEWY